MTKIPPGCRGLTRGLVELKWWDGSSWVPPSPWSPSSHFYLHFFSSSSFFIIIRKLDSPSCRPQWIFLLQSDILYKTYSIPDQYFLFPPHFCHHHNCSPPKWVNTSFLFFILLSFCNQSLPGRLFNSPCHLAIISSQFYLTNSIADTSSDVAIISN